MNRAILTSLLLLCLLPGCNNAPKSQQIRQDLQYKLDNSFSANLFEVSWLKEFGSQPCLTDNTDGPVQLVYYKAGFKVLRDVNLTGWNELNVDALASVLGARPEGITGIKQGGNKTGDELKVWGTIYYAHTSDQWRVVRSEPVSSTSHPPGGDTKNNVKITDEALGFLNTRFVRFRQTGDTRRLTLLKNRVNHAKTRLRLQLAALDKNITLVSGDKNGAYFAVGQGIAKAFQTQNIAFTNVESTGSDENILLVSSAQADFGMAQNDIAYTRYAGISPDFPPGAMTNLRAIGSLYPEAVQIVVAAGSNIHSIDDLRRHRVSLGRPDSGTSINAAQILQAYGINPDTDISRVSTDDMQADGHALAEGKIDAFFTTIGYPAAFIESLATATPLRLLSLTPEVIQQLQKAYTYYVPLSIARNTYSGQNDDVKTVGVTAMIITRADVPNRKVEQLVNTLLKHPSALRSDSAKAYYISPETMPTGISIPWHPAAHHILK